MIEGVEVEAEEVAEYVGVGKKIMRSWTHAEALAIFYTARKWREIRGKGCRFTGIPAWRRQTAMTRNHQ